jgi:NADH dehydrogenase
MILVVGATGFLGRETTKLLLDRGEDVRIMARTPAKAADLQQMGAEIVQGDLIDPPSLEQACVGVRCVFAAAHSLLGAGKYKSENVDGIGHRALIDAAKAAGVSHFVYTSILGVSPDHPVDFFRTKASIEAYLKASGLSYTILRPSAFMELHMHLLNGKSILERGKTTVLGTGAKPRNFVAVRDVAYFACRALTDPTMKNRTIDVGGPQNLTNNQVATLYATLAGVKPKINRMPRAVARILSIVMKPFQPGLSRVLYVASLPDSAFCETFDSNALLKAYTISLTSPETFVHERITERLLKEASPT